MRYAFLFVLALAGCAEMQRAAQTERQEQAKAALTAIQTELRSAIDKNPKIDPIRGKISLHDARQASLPMLSSTDYVSESDKAALEEWQALISASFPKLLSVFQQYDPWPVPLYGALRSSGLTLVADLYAGKITFGQYNRQRLEISTRFVQAIDERRREIEIERARLRQAQQIADAQQSLANSAAFASFSNYLLSQQLINQQWQPARITPFTCTRMGNMTTCN